LQEPKHALTLLHTSDVHSRVWPFRSRISSFEAQLGLGPANALQEVGGAARLGAVLEAERARGDCVWLDSGDWLEGAGVFRRYGGRVELELASSLGLAAMALGNHELSLSGSELAGLLRNFAHFPLLSANLQPAPGSPLRGLVQGSALLSAAGRRLGVVGVANAASPPNLRDDDNPWGLVSIELAAAVQTAVDELMPRAELVVVLSHLGLDGDRQLLRATSGIDIVLGGHQHIVSEPAEWQDDCVDAALRERGCTSRSVPIVHSGAYGKLVSRLELELVPEPLLPQQLEVSRLRLEQVPLGEGAAESPAVSAWLSAFEAEPEAPLAYLAEPLWRRSALGGDSALGDWVTDIVLGASGADVVVLNSSGLRADVEQGLLLRADLELALPFDEPWLVALLSGAQLRRGLERAARRSSARGCESALQVAGLALEVSCSACSSGGAECLRVTRDTPFGARPMLEGELLLVALPAYLTLENADFEAAGRALARPLPAPPSELVAGHIARLSAPPSSAAFDACERELRELSPNRCREGFGAPACPLPAARAAELCRSLPQPRGGRDDRIVLRP
jgi:5'-nucleotidase